MNWPCCSNTFGGDYMCIPWLYRSMETAIYFLKTFISSQNYILKPYRYWFYFMFSVSLICMYEHYHMGQDLNVWEIICFIKSDIEIHFDHENRLTRFLQKSHSDSFTEHLQQMLRESYTKLTHSEHFSSSKCKSFYLL